ncbi:hypothetical protein Pelo_4191 [Pelomyxa schiedti]|nr:hypothetical protein Pelo_4191 [Pelomyxa schiedti]
MHPHTSSQRGALRGSSTAGSSNLPRGSAARHHPHPRRDTPRVADRPKNTCTSGPPGQCSCTVNATILAGDTTHDRPNSETAEGLPPITATAQRAAVGPGPGPGPAPAPAPPPPPPRHLGIKQPAANATNWSIAEAKTVIDGGGVVLVKIPANRHDSLP